MGVLKNTREYFRSFRGYSKEKFSLLDYSGGSGGFFSQLWTQAGELPHCLDFPLMAEQGFRRNSIIHACIRRISRSVAEPHLKAVTVLGEGQFQTDLKPDPLATLLECPNEEQDMYELFEQLLIHLMVAGNAFLYKVRSTSGGVVGIELVRPDLMGILPGKNRAEGKIKAYTIRTDGSGNRQMVDKNDIIHFKLPDAFDEFWGLSPLYTAALYGDIDAQGSDFLRAYFKNRGIPSGMLTFDKPVQKTERDRVRDLWKEQFQGMQGWHNVAVLDANATYTPLSTGVERMNMEGIFNISETRLCMVFGVPPVLIGGMFGLSKASFGSLAAFEQVFWTDTMSPMFARLSRRLTRKLAHEEFGEDRQVVFDLSPVAALAENKSEIRKVALQGWNTGLLTRNESFKMLGLPQTDASGDVIKLQAGAILVPADGIGAVDAINDPINDVVTPPGGGGRRG